MDPIFAFGIAVVAVPSTILLVLYLCIWRPGRLATKAQQSRKVANNTVNASFMHGLVEKAMASITDKALEGYYDCPIDYRDIPLSDAEDECFVQALLASGYRVTQYSKGRYVARW